VEPGARHGGSESPRDVDGDAVRDRADGPGLDTRGKLGVRAIPGGRSSGVGENIVTTGTTNGERVGGGDGGSKLSRPVVPLVEAPAGNGADIVGGEGEAESGVSQVEQPGPVVEGISLRRIGLPDGNDAVVADPVSALGDVLRASVGGKRRVPVVPGDLVRVGPLEGVVDGKLAAVLVDVVIIDARERVAEDRLPGFDGEVVLRGVSDGDDGLSRADVDKAVTERVVLTKLVLELLPISVVLRVDGEALGLGVRDVVGAREDVAVDALLTARALDDVALRGPGKTLTARAREVSLATVGGILIVVVPAVLADEEATTIATVANVVGSTTGVDGGVDVVNLSESPDRGLVAGTVVAVLAERISLSGSTADETVDELGGVEERAIE